MQVETCFSQRCQEPSRSGNGLPRKLAGLETTSRLWNAMDSQSSDEEQTISNPP